MSIENGGAEGTTAFRAEELSPRSLIERLLRKATPARARVALQNVLATTPPSRISRTVIDRIRRENCLSESDFGRVCREIFGTAYRACVADSVLSQIEVDYLVALRRLLDIGEDTVVQLERDTVLPRYQAAVNEVLSDSRVTPEERAKLDGLAAALRISPPLARQRFTQAAGAILQSTFDAATSDRRLSPEEFERFSALAKEFGITPNFDSGTLKTMDRFSLFWRIEHGELPTVTVPIRLQSGESCYFTAAASWLEFRKQSTTVGYYNQGVSLRVMRGVYYHVGASRPRRISSEGLTTLDSGEIYITNKRVIFNGARRNLTLKLDSLLSFQAFSDGFALEKASGKSPHFSINGHAELANVILGTALARC